MPRRSRMLPLGFGKRCIEAKEKAPGIANRAGNAKEATRAETPTNLQSTPIRVAT